MSKFFIKTPELKPTEKVALIIAPKEKKEDIESIRLQEMQSALYQAYRDSLKSDDHSVLAKLRREIFKILRNSSGVR